MNKFLLWAAAVAMMVAPAFAADITGTWTASFETQVGTQNYTYTFKVEGTKLTGTAKSNLGKVRSRTAPSTETMFLSSRILPIRTCPFKSSTRARFRETKSSSPGS